MDVQTSLLDVKSAWMSDALERKQSALSVSPHGFGFSVKPFQIVTVRLQGAEVLNDTLTLEQFDSSDFP